MRKLKFGVFLPFHTFQNKAKSPAQHWSLLRDTVLECERLDYDSVWLDDHLMYHDWPILECWTTLSAIASLTSKIRLGTMVTCNIHRNPALLAKTATTLDVLSNGRLEFGIGAGTQQQEHTAYGYDFPKLNLRIEQLAEALEIITRIWTEPKANYQGKTYRLKDALCEPKPLQKPHPPITVGGSSELLLRKVTARFADRFDWGLPPSFKVYKYKLKLLEQQCKTIGRDFSRIEKSCWPSGQVLIAANHQELEMKLAVCKPANVSLEEFKKTILAGTPDDCIEQLQVYVDLGVNYFMLFFADLPSFEGLRLFAKEVNRKINS